MSNHFHDDDDFFHQYRPKESAEDESTPLEELDPPSESDEIYSSHSGQADAQDEEDSREIFSSSEKKAMVHSSSSRAASHAKGDTILGAKPKKKRRKRAVVGRVLLSCLLVGIITCCMVVGIFGIYVFAFVDSSFDFDLNKLKLDYTSVIYAANPGEEDSYYELAQIHGEKNRIWVDYDDMSPYLGNAIVAIEDKRFYDHDGIDWKRTFSAFVNMFVDIYGNTQGGSTITQQLVKNLTGDDERSPVRKIQEIMRARYVEGNYPKMTILECYINTVHFGKGCDGIQTAAQYYFGKEAKDLTLLECASLAATIQTPSSKNPVSGPEKNKERRELVLSEMLDQEFISQEEYDQAMSEELVLATTGEQDAETSASGVNSYYVDTVIEQVIDDLVEQKGYTKTYAENMIYTGGLKIYSTYNADVQNALDETFADNSNFLKVGKGDVQPQSAITVMDYEGHIVGIVGGRGEKAGKRDFNRATMAKRQPGSSIKPIAAYGPSLEYNLVTYSTKMQNSPITLADGTKYPQKGASGGTVYLHKALERSLNGVSVRLVNKLSPQKSYDFVTKRLGITSLVESVKLEDGTIASDVNLSALALGGCTYGVKVTEMCAAYACFGNLGKYYKPTTYTKITDTFDDVVLEQGEGTPAFGEDTANVMNEMMQKVISGSQGTGASGKIGNWPLFGKTGTTNDNRDRWFIGGSPYYVAACWFGFDENKVMNGLSTNPALKVWKAAMSKIHEDLELKDFPESDLVSYRYYCADTGLLATNHCGNKVLGWYKNSYLPTCSHGGSLLPEVTKPTPVGGSKNDSPSSTSSKADQPPTDTPSVDNTPAPTSSAPVTTSKPDASSAPAVSSSPAESSRPAPSSRPSVSSEKPKESEAESKEPSSAAPVSSEPKPSSQPSSLPDDEE